MPAGKPFFFPCKRRERTPSQARYLFTFLCLPLNTTAKAPCPTRSFLLYSKSPTVSIAMGWWSSWRWAQMDSLECCSPPQKIIPEQIIQSVQAMLLLALRIYFMIRCSCINKRCRQDMVHSHALWVGWDVWKKITQKRRLWAWLAKNPELNCISASCQSLTQLDSCSPALHYSPRLTHCVSPVT